MTCIFYDICLYYFYLYNIILTYPCKAFLNNLFFFLIQDLKSISHSNKNLFLDHFKFISFWHKFLLLFMKQYIFILMYLYFCNKKIRQIYDVFHYLFFWKSYYKLFLKKLGLYPFILLPSLFFLLHIRFEWRFQIKTFTQNFIFIWNFRNNFFFTSLIW